MTALDGFGKLLMKDVRDETILQWRRIADGMLKGERAAKIRTILGAMPPNMKVAELSLVPYVVDSVLHNLLRLIEQEDNLGVTFKDGDAVTNLKEASDGLAGELYSDQGWIARFSNEPST